MEKERFYEQMARARAKAENVRLEVSEGAQGPGDIRIMERDRLYLYDVRTPYTVADVASVAWNVEPEDDPADVDFIRVTFQDGESWTYDDEGMLLITCGLRRFGSPEGAYGPEGPMCPAFDDWQEILERLGMCLERAGITAFTVQREENQIRDLYFERDRFCLKRHHPTPYRVADFREIRTSRGLGYGETSHVSITFANGDMLRLMPDGECEAWLTIGDRLTFLADTAELLETYEVLNVAARTNVDLTEEYVVVDDLLFLYNGGSTAAIVPMGVVRIGAEAFAGSDIELAILPDSVRTIGARAFAGCEKLCQVELNDGLERIDREAFVCCKALEEIELPESLRWVGEDVFLHSGLEDFEFPQEMVRSSLIVTEDDLPF